MLKHFHILPQKELNLDLRLTGHTESKRRTGHIRFYQVYALKYNKHEKRCSQLRGFTVFLVIFRDKYVFVHTDNRRFSATTALRCVKISLYLANQTKRVRCERFKITSPKKIILYSK